MEKPKRIKRGEEKREKGKRTSDCRDSLTCKKGAETAGPVEIPEGVSDGPSGVLQRRQGLALLGGAKGRLGGGAARVHEEVDLEAVERRGGGSGGTAGDGTGEEVAWIGDELSQFEFLARCGM